MSAPRILDYFAVYGLDESAPVSISSLESSDSMADNLNVISSLRLIVLGVDESIRSKSDFIVYLELNTVGDRKLWLEVVYGRLKGVAKSGWTPNGNIITAVALFYMPFEDKVLQVPEDHNMEPVHIVWGNAKLKHGLKKTENGLRFYAGQYDLTTLLSAKDVDTHKLVLMYRTLARAQGQELPIVDIKLVQTETVKTAEGKVKRTVKIPDQYEHLNFQFGKRNIQFMCFKRRNLYAEKDPLAVVYKPMFIEKFPRQDHTDSPLAQAINLFCFPDGVVLSREPQTQQVFTVVLTPNEADSDELLRIYITCLLFYEPVSQGIASLLNLRLSDVSKIYMPKAICLVSHWPFIDRYKQILKQIYRIQMSSNDVPIERVICNLMQEVPLPDQGCTEIHYAIGNETIRFSRPPAKHLFFTEDLCFEMFFRCLRIDDIITLWSATMLEKKILFISAKKSLLTHCALALAALIFPFKWSCVLIPVLPPQFKTYIETIFPYIIGISPGMLTPDIEVPGDAIKIYLDEGRIVMQEVFPRLPEKPKKQLWGRLSQCASLYRKDDPLREAADEAFGFFAPREDERPFDPCEVRDAFLEMQTTLIRSYQRHLILPGEAGQRFRDSRDCFNTAGFLTYHKANKPDQFLYKLTETQHFVHFIESRCFHSDTNHEYAYFDEYLPHSAMRFKRTRAEPCFVKPYQTSDVFLTLTVNDIGFEPGTKFIYSNFPRLNEELFIEPRQVKQFATVQGPKPALSLRDDMLQKLTSGDWAKFLMTTVYRLWFLTFSHCMIKYKSAAQNQMTIALSVLETMKKKSAKPDEEIYRKLIAACGHCGLKESVLLLFKSTLHPEMKNQGIEPDACTHGVYVKAVAEGQEFKRQLEMPLALSDLSPGSLCLNLRLDDAVFLPSDNCPSCEYQLDMEEIMGGWEKSYTNYTTRCVCSAAFTPRFHVSVDQNEYTEAATMAQERGLQEVEFLSPPVLRKELENLIYREGSDFLLARDFCDKHKVLFWNLVLFFQLLKLPVYFLDPNFDTSGIEDLAKGVTDRPGSSSGLRDKSSYPSPRRGRAPSVSAHSEDISDTGSNASGHSNFSHSSAIENKVTLLRDGHRPRSTSKRSTGSETGSVRSVSTSSYIKKVFGAYIEEFAMSNRKRAVEVGVIPADAV